MEEPEVKEEQVKEEQVNEEQVNEELVKEEQPKDEKLKEEQLKEAQAKDERRELGKKGEDAATKFLLRRGYKIVERNWRCPAGEADIIAFDGSTLVFVEVKTRSDIDKGYPEEAITKEKRARYERISAYYLRDSKYEELRFRFDVIGILVLGNNKATLRHHVNAFGVE